MGRRRRDKIEFRFYELPPSESVIALMGDRWVGTYGRKDRPNDLHFHNLFEFGFCRHGRGRLILGDKQNEYHDNMISLIPANYPHNTISDDINYWEYLFFDPVQLVRELFPNHPRVQTKKLAALSQRADLLSVTDYPELAGLADRIFDEMRTKRPYYRECVSFMIRAFLLELLRIQEGKESDTSWNSRLDIAALTQITPSLRFVDEHFHEQIRAGDLARECGLSEVHFRRVFEEYMNMTPMDYVNLIRIQKSCDLMTRKDSSMDIIAQECGFASVSTFTRNFKKMLNTTPYQWKLNKENFRNTLSGYNITALKGWQELPDSLS